MLVDMITAPMGHIRYTGTLFTLPFLFIFGSIICIATQLSQKQIEFSTGWRKTTPQGLGQDRSHLVIGGL